MSTITERVDAILKKRKGKVPEVQKRLDALKGIREEVVNFENLKKQIVDSNGNLIQASSYYSILADIPGIETMINSISVDYLKSLIDNLITKYEEVKERFSREYINIAVVGPARQGKSTFLQSITGLDNRCIPAFTGGHCTGAASTIENGSNENVIAEITYKSENEIIDEIQSYIDIISNKKKRIMSLSELPSWAGTDILERWVEEYVPEKDNTGANRACEMVRDRYVNHYSEWIGLIGKSVETMTDENIIMEYVAQHNGEKKYLDDESPNPEYRAYYKFVAVKSARIIKKFPFEDSGKIKMIDTVGLGSTETNTEGNMMHTIRHESDGVIFFKRPEAMTSGTSDQADGDIYTRIKSEFYERKMDKWFSYILNHTSDGSPFGNNIQMCNTVKEEIRSYKLPLLSQNTIDVSDSEAVKNEFLIPYLTDLSTNISDIDSIIVSEANECAELAYAEFERFYNSVSKVISGKIRNNASWVSVFDSCFGKTFGTNMAGNLRRNLAKWNVEKTKPCNQLQTNTMEICKNMTKLIPSADEIQNTIYTCATKSPAEIWVYYLHRIRTELTAMFIELDESIEKLVTATKNELAAVLYDDDGGRLKYIYPADESDEPYVWLKKFSDNVLDDETSEIKRAIDYLYSFDVSVRGFMMHKIRIHLDIINPNNAEATSIMLPNENTAQAMNVALIKRMNVLRKGLEAGLGAFWNVPNEALYSMVDEFCDRVIFSENVRNEWRNLYSDKYERVWREEFASVANKEIAFAEWSSMVERILEKAKKSNFELRI